MPKVDSHSIRFAATTEELSRVREFIAEFSKKLKISAEQTHEIQMAVDEACTNVIKHAYDYDNSREVELSVNVVADKLVIRIVDDGKSFDPSVYSYPDLKERIKKRQRGGFGIYLIRSFMDEVEYSRQNGYNELRLVRKI